MSIIKKIEKELNHTTTENGDIAYKSTLSANLDFFGVAGASRSNQDAIKDIFKKAMKEDLPTAIKNLFYLRDVRGGLGERDTFRVALGKLVDKKPEVALAFLPYVPEYGRWDDVLVYLDEKETRQAAADFIKTQLEADLKNKREGKSISLCAKWMPSVNASNGDVRKTAVKLAELMGMDKKTYRKTLSELRSGIIVERNLTEKNYTFDYETLPGRALNKYRKAYNTNDKERYDDFKNKIKTGAVEAKVKTLFPHEIIKGFYGDVWYGTVDEAFDPEYAQKQWEAFPREITDSKTIVVRDGSGSMWGTPLNVATAMAIMFSESLTGEFKDKFITFSNEPRLVDLSCADSLAEKVEICKKETEVASTNIEAVYNLIYETSLRVNKEDYIDRIVIISDMQFNTGTRNVPTYETMKQKFEAANLPLPEIVYWNVDARRVAFAADAKNPNIRFVSGMSNNIITDLINNKSINAYDFMMKTLSKYEFVDEVLKNLN